MALIDLKLIGEVAIEALTNEHLFEAHLLGWDRRDAVASDALILGTIKVNRQATNLFECLRKVHMHCVDFSTGNLSAYIEAFEKMRDPEESDFDPFGTLAYTFSGETIHDLPPQIEMYKELCEFMPNYVRLKQIKREGLAKFFGNVRRGYLQLDEEGNKTIVAEEDLPADYVNELKANQAIAEINAEYCLDGYNEFYRRSTELIETHKATGDYVACATGILAMFAPYQVSS